MGEEGKMASKERKVVIVGASAAGLKCASRLARLRPDWLITVVQAQDKFSYAACGFPYVLSGDLSDLEVLHRTADGSTRDVEFFSRVKGVEILAGWRAVALDPAIKLLRILGRDGQTRDLRWDELVLATGARPRRLPGQPKHPRIRSFHTAADVRYLHDGLARGDIAQVILVGAGFLGCELAEAFSDLWGAKVTLLEEANTPLPAQLDPEIGGIVAQTLRAHGVDLHLGTKVELIEPAADQVSVHMAGGKTVVGDVAVVAIGVEPVVELAAAAGLRLGPTGGLAVDERLGTSAPHVWAIGDAAELRSAMTGEPVLLSFGSLANRQGRTLANILSGGQDQFPPVAGAMALKVFDLNVASVGVTRQDAAAHNDNVRSVWMSAHDRAEFWPDAAEIVVQLNYETDSRKVVGVKAVGPGDVSKRVDVATQLLKRGATLSDFIQLEHAYSPAYAAALDPLAVAAMAAENVEEGVNICCPEADIDGFQVLDVRRPEEIEARPLDLVGVTCLTLEHLREHQDEIELRPWMVVCERGARSAEVVRWLKGRGVPAAYLGGGLRWRSLAGLDLPTHSRTKLT
jgi:NADPH-dependent 2,4-dienoyl-CoA reductase/sulfur reductase-like enzyme/rhodanese-related sulfurtransferase